MFCCMILLQASKYFPLQIFSQTQPSERYQSFLIMQSSSFKFKSQNSKTRRTRSTFSSVAHQSQYTSHHVTLSSIPLCIQPTFKRRTSRPFLRNFIAASFLPHSRNKFCLSYHIFSDFMCVKLVRPTIHHLKNNLLSHISKIWVKCGESECPACSTDIEEIGQVYMVVQIWPGLIFV